MSTVAFGKQVLQAGQETSSGNLLKRPTWPAGYGYSISAPCPAPVNSVQGTTTEAVFAARWTHPTKICIITRILGNFFPRTSPGGNGGYWAWDAVIGRNFTANLAGGVVIVPEPNNSKHLTNYPYSQMGQIRYCTTSGLTIPASVALDTDPLGREEFWLHNFASGDAEPENAILDLDWRRTPVTAPVLRQNEGVFVRYPDFTVSFDKIGQVMMEWLEVDSLD
jgi:hypothetical protein